MVEKITWSKEAIHTFFQICDYVKGTWTIKEVEQFEYRVKERLNLIKSNPRLGNLTGNRPNIHKTLVHKKVLLIYRYKPIKKEIVLLNFWNTLQNPGKLKINKK